MRTGVGRLAVVPSLHSAAFGAVQRHNTGDSAFRLVSGAWPGR